MGIVNSSSCLSKITFTLSPIEISDTLSVTIFDIILAPSFNVIDATIYGISVLKAKEAIKKYGSKGAHGVIEITGKKKDQH